MNRLLGFLCLLTLASLYVILKVPIEEPFFVFSWYDFTSVVLFSGVLAVLWIVFIAQVARQIRSGRLPLIWFLASLWYVLMMFGLYNSCCYYLSDLYSVNAQMPWSTTKNVTTPKAQSR